MRPYPGRIGVGSPPVLLSSNGEGIRSYGSVIGAAPQRECAGSRHSYPSCMQDCQVLVSRPSAVLQLWHKVVESGMMYLSVANL